MGLAWATPVKVLDNIQVFASAEASPSTGIDLDSCVGVVGFSVACVFNAAATAGAALKVYPCYDGTNYANVPIEEAGIAVNDAGNATECHLYFPISCQKVKVAVENLDETYSITGVSVWAHKQTFSS